MSNSEKLDTIVNSVKVFKAEQEIQLLKSRTFHRSINPSRENDVEAPMTEGGVLKILNSDCVIMPASVHLSDNSKLWPQSLTANFFTRAVTIGPIESKGTLWKIIQQKTELTGVYALLQTSVSIVLLMHHPRSIMEDDIYCVGNRRAVSVHK
jgi:hypothetical protein